MDTRFQIKNLLLKSPAGRWLLAAFVVTVFLSPISPGDYLSSHNLALTSQAAVISADGIGKGGDSCAPGLTEVPLVGNAGFRCATPENAQKLQDQQAAAQKEGGSSVASAMDPILNFVGRMFLWLTSFLAQLGGMLFDTSIAFSLAIGGTQVIDSVKGGWAVFRDVANMFFIFVLVYIAFATMLQLSNFNTKQVLAKLVIVGVLLNFSLFFSQIVVDVSNVLAYTLYKNVSVEKPNKFRSVSEVFMTKFGTVDIYKTGKGNLDLSKTTISNLWIVMFMGGILLFVSAFVFAAGAALFLIRTVKLLFLMVLSPLAFIAFVLPGTQDYAKKWWHALLGESFVAPLFLLFIYLTILMSKKLADVTLLLNTSGEKGLAGELSKLDSVATIFNFVLLIGLMIASLIFAKNLSESTATMAMGWAQKGTRAVGKNTLGLAGSGIAGAGAWLGKKGYTKWNRALNTVGGGLRNRSYDVGRVPGASQIGMSQLKDMRNLGQWWKDRSDAEKKRKAEVFGNIKDPSARLRFLQGMLSDKQRVDYYTKMSPYERAELRIKDKTFQDSLEKKFTIDEREKTESARKHVASSDTLTAVKAAPIVTNEHGKRTIDMKDAKVLGEVSKMKDEHVSKLGLEAVGTQGILENMRPAQFKRWAIANEDKIDENAAKDLATSIVGDVKRGVSGIEADKQHDVYEQLLSTKGSSAGAKYIRVAMKNAGYKTREELKGTVSTDIDKTGREEYGSPTGA